MSTLMTAPSCPFIFGFNPPKLLLLGQNTEQYFILLMYSTVQQQEEEPTQVSIMMLQLNQRKQIQLYLQFLEIFFL